LEFLQKHINFHFSVTLDLFGAEVSTNAANGFAIGLKGRFQESRIADDHRLRDATYSVLHRHEGAFVSKQVPGP
jgi:benzoyl-CoA 2,3-dioxygenase component B